MFLLLLVVLFPLLLMMLLHNMISLLDIFIYSYFFIFFLQCEIIHVDGLILLYFFSYGLHVYCIYRFILFFFSIFY